jgi:hypothetical protein
MRKMNDRSHDGRSIGRCGGTRPRHSARSAVSTISWPAPVTIAARLARRPRSPRRATPGPVGAPVPPCLPCRPGGDHDRDGSTGEPARFSQTSTF